MAGSKRRSMKVSRKQGRREKRGGCSFDDRSNEQPPQLEVIREKRVTKPLSAKTEAQAHYIINIQNKRLTFGLGPAGTGKTYVCTALAAEALRDGRADKLILTRPAVEAGESMGFLPGELEEKFDPYMIPFREILNEYLGRSTVDYMIKYKKIEAAPLGFMRGRTFRDAWVILDEAQNTTPVQMKMFLTRIGENAKVIVNGDTSQKDIPGESGLQDAVNRLFNSSHVGTTDFSVDDVVRSGLVKEILQAYAV